MRAHAVLLAAVVALLTAAAHADVAVPPLTARVTDQTATLTPDQRTTLERRLAEFEQRKGTQIAVLLVPTTAPETIEQYAIRVAEAWKLGRKGVDDGALLVVAKDDRALRIEVGYGLEGVIPDAIAKRVIDEVMLPFFKRGDFYGGIEAGTAQLMRLVDGEPLPPPAARDPGWNSIFDLLPLLFVAVFVGGGLLRALFGRLVGASVAGGVVGIAAWIMLGLGIAVAVGMIVFVLVLVLGFNVGTGRRGHGGWGGGIGGGGWSGGGGFSGGGGGFGGGGASGKW